MREYPKWRDFLMEQLAEPKAAVDYLHITLEEFQLDKDITFFLKEVQTVIEAQGGVNEIAKRATMCPETLLEILSSEEAPPIDIFVNILSAFGCKLTIQTINDNGISRFGIPQILKKII
ncbi:hypothetical protein C6501_19600 [Candidatus Poribacteria bacterium]|nr:MAG: hypothetical protein C6501_19600 [Candidatus Poribacteria bacterium]